MITLHRSGLCFLDCDRPFVPVGVNYWPASCGVEMWARWPEEEIKTDLALVRRLGMDTVRFFLRWQDFEPDEGRFDQTQFTRLDRILGWFAELGLKAHPSLFVGWMSGGTFWPSWKRGRNLFSDPVLRARSARFAAEATRVVSRHREHVLAIDLGNELNCLAEAHAASPADNAAWFREVSAAVKGVDPALLLVSGNEQGQILRDVHRFDAQHGTDLLSMHGYPVPSWHACEFDGMADPLCCDLLPCYCAAARSFAPVMLQEFGTILTTDGPRMRRYLKPMLSGSRRAGANAFLYWCLRDIPPVGFPYSKVGMESGLGLVDAQDRVKDGFEPFLELSSVDPLQNGPPPPTALVWPRHWYDRDNPENPGNQPRECGRRLAHAFHQLSTLSGQPAVVRLGQPIPSTVETLVIAGVALDQADQEDLLAWVRDGGRLLWHGPTAMQWGPTMAALTGARPMDYRARLPVDVAAFGKVWSFPATTDLRCEVRIDDAVVVARDEHGLPAVGVQTVGAGRVAWALPRVEDAVAAEGPRPAARAEWNAWYLGMLALLG